MKKILVIALSTLMFASACSNGPATENKENGDLVAVNVEEVTPSTFNHYLNIQGTVESDKTISITPKAAATVEEINVQAGDVVRKGAVLAKLDGEVTRTQIAEVESQLKLAKTRYERQKNLREDDIGSEIQLLEAETQVRSLENKLATLQEQYDNYTITATIGGTVNRVYIKEGVNIGPAEPAFQIANSEALKVTAEISEAYITRVDRTDSVRVQLPSLDRQLTKTIDVVSQVIDPSNRMFTIEVYIPNIDGMVRPNMLAKLRVNDVTRSNEVTIPLNAIQQPEGNAFVYVAKQDNPNWVASKQPIKLGLTYNDQALIEKGLRPGDRLITVGYNALSDQTPITIQEN
ncbi:RND family efflux transporter, MFP subunit [Fodinibius salinus]|uniref:RND family efflux transporter, MFP subunit n=1 Tax=Fodinibius salinus TaxID=860790 RepID=A0A5D3YIK4_9BACT|nr:efflux RND transporter periplasmic adaptor subunit [Fodinibius salinus]TYP93402.1 RND family efflux transporter, MFP subunit [Fodinibius salinus]